MHSDKAIQLWPDSASTVANRVDVLAISLLLLCTLVTLIIIVLIVGFAFRYRRRSENDRPAETKSHTWMEIAWSVGPLILMMATFAWGSSLYIDMKRPPRSALEINVAAKRWMWKLQHPTGQREINELHIPTGRPVKLIMTSQDVIHSFFIPAFRIKQDVLPGSYSTQWFEATTPGEYHLFCAEYCGTLHSQMTGRIIVMSPQDYEAWLAGVVANELPASSGARLFTRYGCAQCHGQTAPTLAGLFGREVKFTDGKSLTADEQYLRESIIDPAAKLVAGYPPVMPSYRGQLSEEQLSELIAYIKLLSDASTTQPTPLIGPDRIPNMPPARQPATPNTGGVR